MNTNCRYISGLGRTSGRASGSFAAELEAIERGEAV
jgi:hypothetical protein